MFYKNFFFFIKSNQNQITYGRGCVHSFRSNTLGFLIKFKYIFVLILIIFEKYNIGCTLLVNANIYSINNKKKKTIMTFFEFNWENFFLERI